jgi:hypothetical protein
MFHTLFSFLDAENLLHVNEPLQMKALHSVFLPRPNEELEKFRNQWNHHGIRTAGHQTPTQMFVRGSLEQHRSSHVATRDLFAGAWSAAQQNVHGSVSPVDHEPDIQQILQEHQQDITGIDSYIAVRQFLTSN